MSPTGPSPRATGMRTSSCSAAMIMGSENTSVLPAGRRAGGRPQQAVNRQSTGSQQAVNRQSAGSEPAGGAQRQRVGGGSSGRGQGSSSQGRVLAGTPSLRLLPPSTHARHSTHTRTRTHPTR